MKIRKNKPWEEININTWEEFDQKISEMTHREWLFRGQSNADWGLQTSLDRMFSDIQPIIESGKGIIRIFRFLLFRPATLSDCNPQQVTADFAL